MALVATCVAAIGTVSLVPGLTATASAATATPESKAAAAASATAAKATASANQATADRKATEQALANADTAATSAQAELDAITSDRGRAEERAQETGDVEQRSPQASPFRSRDTAIDLKVAKKAGLTATTEIFNPSAKSKKRTEQIERLVEKAYDDASEARIALHDTTNRQRSAIVDVQHTTTAKANAEQELAAATEREKTAVAEQTAAVAAQKEAEAAAVAAQKRVEAERARAAAAAQASRSMNRPVDARVTSPYGMRTHPVTGVYKLHTGVDFSAGNGVARAARGGTVVDTGYDGAYGNMVTISHGTIDGDKVVTRYAHLAKIDVRVGQKVSAGTRIGQIGSTGYSTGRHLHFEVLVNGDFTDPMRWL